MLYFLYFICILLFSGSYINLWKVNSYTVLSFLILSWHCIWMLFLLEKGAYEVDFILPFLLLSTLLPQPLIQGSLPPKCLLTPNSIRILWYMWLLAKMSMCLYNIYICMFVYVRVHVCACRLPIASYWQPAPWECWAILLDLGAMAWLKGIPLVIPISLKQPLPSSHPPSCPVPQFPYLETISDLACLKRSYLCLPHLALPTVSPIFINGNSVLPANTFCLSWLQTRLIASHHPHCYHHGPHPHWLSPVSLRETLKRVPSFHLGSRLIYFP